MGVLGILVVVVDGTPLLFALLLPMLWLAVMLKRRGGSSPIWRLRPSLALGGGHVRFHSLMLVLPFGLVLGSWLPAVDLSGGTKTG